MLNRGIGCRLALCAMVGLLLGSAPAYGQDVDVAGEWVLSVRTDQGTTNPRLTLEQDGTTLSGMYRSDALGEQSVTGTVEGSSIVVSFTSELQGQSFPVEYRGTLGDDGVITGTMDLANGAFEGTFTAVRADGDQALRS